MDAINVEKLIELSVRESNILPITSGCDGKCVFCSHKNNPRSVRTFSIGQRSYEDVVKSMALLDGSQVITIGESATTIMEGEPFTHPRILDILRALRERFAHTPVEITTNGHYLTRETIGALKALGAVTLNLSLNSATVEGRLRLMGDSEALAKRTIASVRHIRDYNLPFSGSLVAMPDVTGWADIRATVDYLAENGAATVRIYVPAFADGGGEGFPDPNEIYGALHDFVRSLPKDMACPVLLEPSRVSGLEAEVSGVMKDSPADKAGLLRDDVLTQINGRRPATRVEAWNLLAPKGEIAVRLLRGCEEMTLRWVNPCEKGSGVVMEYDFDPERARYIKKLAEDCPGKSLALCSELAYGVLKAVFDEFHIRAGLRPVKNRTFGGSIKAAGLLTVDDYAAEFESYLAEGNERPMQLIVPSESFSALGYDLKGRYFSELKKRTGVYTAVN